MGIQGLLQIIKRNKVFDVVDLVEEAKNKGELEILVDFNALIRYFSNVILRKIEADYKYGYVACPIGVYDLLSEAFEDLHRGFADVGIRLVWVVDGPKGLDEEASSHKADAWSKRDNETLELIQNVMSACQYQTALPDLRSYSPILTFECALGALKNTGAEVIYLLQGMADDFIAYEFHRRKAYAILTNDTDFAVFPGCTVIFDRFLNFEYRDDDMKIPFISRDCPGKVFKKPSSLNLPLVKQDKLLRWFKFTNDSQMITLSILLGNDNTKKFSQSLAENLGIRRSHSGFLDINAVAEKISINSITPERLVTMPEIKNVMNYNPEVRASIQFCLDMYSLKRIKDNMKASVVIYDPGKSQDPLTAFLAKKMSSGEITRYVYSLHFGIRHDVLIPERPSENCPPILVLLAEIRKKLYPYLLNARLNEVVEWRFRTKEPFVKVPVRHASIKTNDIKPKADLKGQVTSIYGIDLFEEVICHLEEHGPLHLVRRYGMEKAFLCYILRYMYLLTKEKNLILSKEEVKSLFVTVFYLDARAKKASFACTLEKDFFLRMGVCPTERCLIIGMWFMNIYYTAKYLCGAAFNLTEEFPEVHSVMNGPVFYGIYEHLLDPINKRVQNLDRSMVSSLEEVENNLLKIYSEEYGVVTQ